MNDNQKKPKALQLTSVRGFPGIYKVLVWNEEKQNYMSPRLIVSCRQKPYRAVRWIRVLGKRKQQGRFFDRLEQARAWRMETNPESPKERSSSYTVKNLLDDWREWSKPPRLQKGTWDLYGKDLVHLKFLYDVPMNELTPHDIDAWLRHCLGPSYPKKSSRVSFLREVKTLTTVFNWYRERKDNLFQSPILRRHRTDAFFKAKPAKEDVSLSVEELEKFLERLRQHHRPVYYYLASFQALCGARVGEACGIEWQSVHLDFSVVEIKQICAWDFKTKVPYLRKGTKTGEVRRVVIPPRLVELLREWKENGVNGPLVFHNDGVPLRYNAIQSAYKKAYRAVGIPERSTHVLRHTFATIYSDQTNDIRATQSAMGHQDLRITQHYAKVAERNQRKAIQDFALGRSKPDRNIPPPEGTIVIPLVRKKETA
ncbi:MAG TPA: site-specific integrase [Bdellovibrionota bacterium]|nr:site-specific integrase [Bdellovibrionota bacterium]